MAAGDTLITLTASHSIPASTAPWGVVNNSPVRVYAGGSNKTTVYEFIMPQHFNAGGIKVISHLDNLGTTGNVDIDTELAKVTDAVDSYAAAQSTDDTDVPGTAKDTFKVETDHTSAQIDGIIKGDRCRLRITRDAVNDTNGDETRIFAVELRETA
jgi:hypothetical protein